MPYLRAALRANSPHHHPHKRTLECQSALQYHPRYCIVADHSIAAGCLAFNPPNRGDREQPSCRCACSKWARKLPSDAARCARTRPWHSMQRIATVPRRSNASPMLIRDQAPPDVRASQTSSCADSGARRVTAVTLVTALWACSPSRRGVCRRSMNHLGHVAAILSLVRSKCGRWRGWAARMKSACAVANRISRDPGRAVANRFAICVSKVVLGMNG